MKVLNMLCRTWAVYAVACCVRPCATSTSSLLLGHASTSNCQHHHQSCSLAAPLPSSNRYTGATQTLCGRCWPLRTSLCATADRGTALCIAPASPTERRSCCCGRQSPSGGWWVDGGLWQLKPLELLVFPRLFGSAMPVAPEVICLLCMLEHHLLHSMVHGLGYPLRHAKLTYTGAQSISWLY